MEESNKKSHAGVAVGLGILGLIIGVVGGLGFGVIAGGLSVLLGVIALVLGIQAKKVDGKGKGGKITGVISLIIGILTILIFLSIGSSIRTSLDESKTPILYKYGPKFKYGMVGFAAAISGDNISSDDLSAELNSISESSGSTTTTTSESN